TEPMQRRCQRTVGYIAFLIRPEGVEQHLLAHVPTAMTDQRLQQRESLLRCLARKLQRLAIAQNLKSTKREDAQWPRPPVSSRSRWPQLQPAAHLSYVFSLDVRGESLRCQKRQDLRLHAHQKHALVAPAQRKCGAQFVMAHRAVPVQECLIGLNEVRLVCKMSVCGSRELGPDLAERLRAFLCVVRPCTDDRQQQLGLEFQHEQTAVTSSIAMPAGAK